MIRLAFRLDDPSETSHQGVEAGILEALQRHSVPATFAVIPFRIVDGERRALSAVRAQPLLEAHRAGLVEIAQHGHVHIRRHPEPAAPTEFCGRTRAEQQALIGEGKKHLESIFGGRICGFVPPWNSYDAATAGSLLDLGFDYLSAGWQLPAADHGALRLLPRTAQVKEFDTAFSEALRFEAASPILVFVLHHYDFAESGSAGAPLDLPRFGQMLARALAHPRTRVSTLSQLAQALPANDRRVALQQRLAGKRILGRLLPRSSLLDGPLWRGILAGLGA